MRHVGVVCKNLHVAQPEVGINISLSDESDITDFPKTVSSSVLTDRNAVGPTISKYISDQMSGKTYIFERTGD